MDARGPDIGQRATMPSAPSARRHESGCRPDGMTAFKLSTQTVPMILLWAGTLGLAGFLSGFFGPLALAPDANQGPLVGIFISGPGGAVLGAILGACVSHSGWTAQTRSRALIGSALMVSIVTLYFCIPGHRHVATLVDGDIRTCVPAASLRNGALARLKAIEDSRPARSAEDWSAMLDQALKDNPRVVLTIRVARSRQIREGRAPWNHGRLDARPWVPSGATADYLLEKPGSDCGDFPVGRPGAFAVGGHVNIWPPYGLAEMLGMQTASPVPAQYAHLAGY